MEKRGVLLILLVLFLIIVSGFVVGEIDISNVNTNSFLRAHTPTLDGEDSAGGTNRREMDVVFDNDVSGNANRYVDSREGCIVDGWENDDVFAENPVGGNDDDWGLGYIKQEVQVDWDYSEDFTDTNRNGDKGEGNYRELIRLSKIRSDNSDAYICASSKKWYACSNSVVGYVVWTENKRLFVCGLDQNGFLEWEDKGKDGDEDGYIDTGDNPDCYDDKSKDPSFCKDITSPTQCSQDIIKYGVCSICVNPGATEICGDKIGDDSNADPTSGKGNDCNTQTSNKCDKNQFACTQTSPSPDQPAQDNIYGEPFSWIQTSEGGYCCGYKGIEDNGKVLPDSDLQQHLCLNKNFVRGETDISNTEYWGADIDPTKSTCSGNWCWVNYN